MTYGVKPWHAWEVEVQDRLGLRSTIASGNKFYDPSDGVDVREAKDIDFRVMVDAKCTEGISFRFTKRLMSQWVRKAQEMGFRFALPVRLTNGEVEEGSDEITDYVVITFEDYLELVESYREKNTKTVEEPTQVVSDEDIELLEKIAGALKPKMKSRLYEIIEKVDKK